MDQRIFRSPTFPRADSRSPLEEKNTTLDTAKAAIRETFPELPSPTEETLPKADIFGGSDLWGRGGGKVMVS